MKNKILLLAALLFSSLPFTLHAGIPKAGEKAPDFALKTLDGQTVRLSDLTARDKVVLVVLRGWPGYQCPLCERQVHDYASAAARFTAVRAHVVMVYPGPADDLKAHAKEFLDNQDWPSEFTFVIDPDYSMINAYGLRWNALSETAYPSTFVVDKKRVVRFAKISHEHGNRSRSSEVIQEIKAMPEE